MKKLLFMASVMMLSVSAFAQHEPGSLTIQPKVGVNIANLTGEGDSSPRIGLAAGAEFQYQVSRAFGLSAGLVYSMQGAKTSGIYEDLKVKTTVKTDYINIPIMANIYVVRGLALKFGIQPGFNVNSSYKVSSEGVSVSGSLHDIGYDIKSFDFSIPVGLSYEFSNVMIDGRYNIGTTKIVDGEGTRNSVFQFTVGYKFRL